MRSRRRNSGVGAAVVALAVLAALLLPASSFARAGPFAGGQTLRLVLPLTADASGLRRFALAVTTPGSPQYAQYEPIAWLARHFGASRRTQTRVVRFLRAAGASGVRIDATGLFADATLSAAIAERLFAAPVHEFRAARGGRFTAPESPPRIPAGLRGAVTGVVGLDTSAVLSRSAQGPSGYEPGTGTPTGCPAGLAAGGFAPNQYLTAYGYVPLQAQSTLGQGERVALIEIDGFRDSDIATFARCFGLRVPPIDAFGVGVRKALPPGGESTLDLEVLDAAAPGLKGIDVYESDPEAADVLMALTAPLQNPGFKPQVISASLGLCEATTEEAVGRAGISASEGALEEAAASGISFLAAAGDDGSADCVKSSSANALPEPVLAVNYPASSTWATGVGGTNLVLNPQNAILSQPVWNDAGADAGAAGGGGFSELFSRPGYQTGTVAPNHRAVPDMALLADIAPGYDVFCTATPDCVTTASPDPWLTVGGTSAATPLLAGGFALVDELLREHKLQGLGLANPLLYQIGRDRTEAASIFQDVTSGSNDVGPFIQRDGAPLGCCTAGAGFDEASGWGGIDLAAFAADALATQPVIVDVGLSLPPGQHPVRAEHVLANVSCTGRCVLGAFARVKIGRARPFTAFSAVYHLTRQGQKTIRIPFSATRLNQLRAALEKHTRITATVRGAILDSAGNIERETAAQPLAITR